MTLIDTFNYKFLLIPFFALPFQGINKTYLVFPAGFLY